MDIEDITSTVAFVLDGRLRFDLKRAGYQIASLDDLGEIYIRSNGGEIFCLTVAPKSAEEVESWGIEFD